MTNHVHLLVSAQASAPMSAGILFHASAELTASSTLDVSELTSELENLSNELMVDITLDEAIRC